MTQLLAFLVILVAAAVGDAISVRTRARIPSLLVIMFIFMIGFWTIFPKNLIETSGLIAMAGLASPIIVTHMGTLMSLRQVGNQWKALLVGFGALVGVALLLLTIYSAIYGMPMAVAAAAPISGGIVAGLMAMDAMKAVGRPELQVLVMLFLSLQSLIGMPLAANLLKRDVRKNWDKIISTHQAAIANNDNAKKEKKLIPPLPREYQTPFLLLAKLALVAWLAVSFAGLLNNVIHPYIMTLVFGLLAYYLGFLEEDILTKANSSSFLMLLLIAALLPSMTQATPQLIASMIVPLLVGFALGVVGIGVMSYIVGRFLGLSPEMAFSIGSTALYGFPGNYMIVQEVSRSASKDPEEQRAVLNYIMPPMIVGGYATVTIGSVFLTGILINFL
ncbi:TPA: hypothetical protein GXX44_00670 [bacterium]|jgi:MFS family permease|nr:hypothetical protein [bacterium]HPC77027.1 hypothetical protein [bacterium]